MSYNERVVIFSLYKLDIICYDKHNLNEMHKMFIACFLFVVEDFNEIPRLPSIRRNQDGPEPTRLSN